MVAQTAHFCVSGAIRTLRKYAFDTNRVFMRWLLASSVYLLLRYVDLYRRSHLGDLRSHAYG